MTTSCWCVVMCCRRCRSRASCASSFSCCTAPDQVLLCLGACVTVRPPRRRTCFRKMSNVPMSSVRQCSRTSSFLSSSVDLSAAHTRRGRGGLLRGIILGMNKRTLGGRTGGTVSLCVGPPATKNCWAEGLRLWPSLVVEGVDNGVGRRWGRWRSGGGAPLYQCPRRW